MKITVSLDNAVLEQLLAYIQAKTAKEAFAVKSKFHLEYDNGDSQVLLY